MGPGPPSLPSASSMTGAFPNGLSSGFLNHFLANGPEYNQRNAPNTQSPIDLDKYSET